MNVAKVIYPSVILFVHT